MTEMEYLNIVNELRPQFAMLNEEEQFACKDMTNRDKMEMHVTMREFKKFAVSQKKFAEDMMKRRNVDE